MGVSFEECAEKHQTKPSKFDHPLIPQCLVYEEVSLGSLYHYLHVKQLHFSFNQALQVLLQVRVVLNFILTL